MGESNTAEFAPKTALWKRVVRGVDRALKHGVVEPKVELADMNNAAIVKKVNQWRGTPAERDLAHNPLTAADVLMACGYMSSNFSKDYPKQAERVGFTLEALVNQGVLAPQTQQMDRYGQDKAYVVADKFRLEGLAKLDESALKNLFDAPVKTASNPR